jgi:hypothetical protein
VLIPWLSLFDFATVRANFVKPVDLDAVKKRSEDYALLVPIFNDTKYLTNIEFLKKYADKVVLCTTTHETPEFIASLKQLANTWGFRISYSEVGSGVKNPWAIYHKSLLAHDAVLKASILSLAEKYVIFIDGDTWVDGKLSVLAGAMDEQGFDISSVKVLPSRRTNLIENLQGVEYDVAMQARLIYPWLTSGAGMIAKREVMMEIMKNHSLFFNGGDIEIGKLADLMGYKVGHLPMPFYTDVPTSIPKWIKQRFSWMCGCFRHAIINFHHNLNYPFHFIYFSFMIYFLFFAKLREMFYHWYMLPLIIGIYMVITYLANWKVRSKWMFLFPFYALFQVLVILWLGIWRYVITVARTKNFGLIKVTHNPNNLSWLNPNYAFKQLRNYSSIAAAMGVILVTSNGPTQEHLFGRRYETEELLILASNTLRNDGLNLLAQIQHPPQGEVAGASTDSESVDQFKVLPDEFHVSIENPKQIDSSLGAVIDDYCSAANLQLNEVERTYVLVKLSEHLFGDQLPEGGIDVTIPRTLLDTSVKAAISIRGQS